MKTLFRITLIALFLVVLVQSAYTQISGNKQVIVTSVHEFMAAHWVFKGDSLTDYHEELFSTKKTHEDSLLVQRIGFAEDTIAGKSFTRGLSADELEQLRCLVLSNEVELNNVATPEGESFKQTLLNSLDTLTKMTKDKKISIDSLHDASCDFSVIIDNTQKLIAIDSKNRGGFPIWVFRKDKIFKTLKYSTSSRSPLLKYKSFSVEDTFWCIVIEDKDNYCYLPFLITKEGKGLK